MGTIAKGEITISSVNDAYTVLLTPSSCSISAEFDGSNPALSNAKGTITVKRGTKEVPFKIEKITSSNNQVKVSVGALTGTTISFAITQIPRTVLSGNVKFRILTQDGFAYSTEVTFSFNIVRESTMLDWIQDWETNKTSIGDSYVITPKIFVGKNIPDGADMGLTGVYIGPAGVVGDSTGVFGYKNSVEIFHINEDGGFIGGWTFNQEGMQSGNGVINILSEGSIYANNSSSDTPYWGLYADGHATFANGNVKFMKDGSAEFSGTIKSPNGIIGGWGISKNQLHANRIVLDSYRGVIGIDANSIIGRDQETGDYVFPENPDGGVKMWYNSAADFGFAGWAANNKVFQIGSTNMIAGWNFNHEAIWFGTGIPALTQGSYTSKSNSITIATSGIRSNKWFIDANGSASFVGGSVKFNAENAEMFGWLMRSGRFSSKHTALVSDNSNAGVYVSVADISEVSGLNLRGTISQNGGIYLYSDGVNSIMRAYDTAGNVGFSLRSTGYNTIAGWAFDANTIYIGSNKLSQDGFTVTEGSMVLSSSGIFGCKWKFLADGSGALAGGKINWDKNGNITVDAKISANNITTGTISTASIKCKDCWMLDYDGSGFLANNNIKWDVDGNVTIMGEIKAISGTIGGIEIYRDHIGVVASSNESGNGDWANLSIYKDFFKVGGEKGYVMFGNDVIPSSLGGAFTAVGRIENNAPNIHGNYGFDQANYGLLIDVTGGTKNYGIKSNAALMAPSFIPTKAGVLTFTGNGYKIDFSQNNIILMYYNDPNYSGVNVELPSEHSVAMQFGLNALPQDFATIVIFRVRTGSKKITLQGIYDQNENIANYPMMAGDSVMVLITKVDGFRYQILNYNC